MNGSTSRACRSVAGGGGATVFEDAGLALPSLTIHIRSTGFSSCCAASQRLTDFVTTRGAASLDIVSTSRLRGAEQAARSFRTFARWSPRSCLPGLGRAERGSAVRSPDGAAASSAGADHALGGVTGRTTSLGCRGAGVQGAIGRGASDELLESSPRASTRYLTLPGRPASTTTIRRYVPAGPGRHLVRS